MTGDQPQLGAVTIAVRMLDGGYLAVQASQGRWHFDADTNVPPDAKHRPHTTAVGPPLSGPVLSGAQVAELAANPDMLA